MKDLKKILRDYNGSKTEAVIDREASEIDALYNPKEESLKDKIEQIIWNTKGSNVMVERILSVIREEIKNQPHYWNNGEETLNMIINLLR